MKLDSLHFALLVAIVLLAVYVARGYGLFKEPATPHSRASLHSRAYNPICGTCKPGMTCVGIGKAARCVWKS